MGKDQVSHLLIANLEDVISPMPSSLYSKITGKHKSLMASKVGSAQCDCWVG